MLRPLTLAACLLLPTAATAADTVTLGPLGQQPADQRQARFESVVRELAMGIAAAPNHPVASLGLYELDLGVETRLTFVHSQPIDGEDQSSWDLMTDDGESTPLVVLPSLVLRKGLPFGIEVDARVGTVPGRGLFVAGGGGRVAIADNWLDVPDIAIGLHYQGLVGSDELELGVSELDLSVGKTFVAPSTALRAPQQFSPYGGYSLLLSHARAVAIDYDLQPVGALDELAGEGVKRGDFVYHRVFFGFGVRSSSFVLRLGGGITFGREGEPMGHLDFQVGVRI